MKKTNEILKMWKEECNKPLSVVFSIQIDRQDFNEMVREIEELQGINKKLQKKLDAKITFVSNGNEEYAYSLQERIINLEEENEQLKKDKAFYAKIISMDMKKIME